MRFSVSGKLIAWNTWNHHTTMPETSHDGRTEVSECLLYSSVVAYSNTSCARYNGTWGRQTVPRCPEPLLLFHNSWSNLVFNLHAVNGPGQRSWDNDWLLAGRAVRVSNTGGSEILRTRPDRPCGPPSLLYNGYWVSFPGVKRPGRDVDHLPHPAPRFKERVELNFYSPLSLRSLF
jgi:hypothetical protein